MEEKGHRKHLVFPLKDQKQQQHRERTLENEKSTRTSTLVHFSQDNHTRDTESGGCRGTTKGKGKGTDHDLLDPVVVEERLHSSRRLFVGVLLGEHHRRRALQPERATGQNWPRPSRQGTAGHGNFSFSSSNRVVSWRLI